MGHPKNGLPVPLVKGNVVTWQKGCVEGIDEKNVEGSSKPGPHKAHLERLTSKFIAWNKLIKGGGLQLA